MFFQISPKEICSHWKTRIIRNWIKKYNKVQRKLFFQHSDGIDEHQLFPEDKIHQSSNGCIENPIDDIIQNNQPLDKKPLENSQNNQILGETLAIAINGWDKLPDKIVEKKIDTGR